MLQEQFIHNYLRSKNFVDYTVNKLPQDASKRVYYRIYTQGKSYILMDAREGEEDINKFCYIDELLIDNSFKAPKIIHKDLDAKILILEDLGDIKLNTALSNSEVNEDTKTFEYFLYKKAVDLLIRLQKVQVPDEVEQYSKEILIKESMLFVDWYIPTLLQRPLEQHQIDAFKDIMSSLLTYKEKLNIPRGLVLRDYHADNLMIIQNDSGVSEIGLLDFQDALNGSIIYDLVSLLEDARRDVSSEMVTSMLNYYISQTGIDRKGLLAAYNILGVQRNLKIVGVFTRKAVRDNNTSYLAYLPRVFDHISNNLKHPLLIDLQKWVNEIFEDNMVNLSEKDIFNKKIIGF